MAQPFEDTADGFSQRLDSEELASGVLAFNLRYWGRVGQANQRQVLVKVLAAEGKSFEAQATRAPPRLIGGEPLRGHLKAIGAGVGDEVLIAFHPDGSLGVTMASPSEMESMSEMSSQSPKSKSESALVQAKAATNTIFYGPPGTGKTFSTARQAVLLCDGPSATESSDAEIRERYEALRREGRVTFVTFHQSYGYEEFVEGLRPHVTEGGQVAYSVVPGAFKRACVAATMQRLVQPGLSGKPLRERTIFKMSFGFSGSEMANAAFDYSLRNGFVLLDRGGETDFSGCTNEDEVAERALAMGPEEAGRKQSGAVWCVNQFMHKVKVGDLIVATLDSKRYRGIAEVTGEYQFVEEAPLHQARTARWLTVYEAGRPIEELYAKRVQVASLSRFEPEHVDFERLEELLSDTPLPKRDEPHVIIIDEINRANVSKVFGELITLIEPDKREGMPSQVTVKLPYSGEDFTVPANLHVIGTMNTADRSIALLDTALRRRFDFVEVAPAPSLLEGKVIEGVELARVLEAINSRIEVLYDRDHMIGHAYFMPVKTMEDLDSVFRRKVLPLLQEYFFENWSKVRRVLQDTGAGEFILKTTPKHVPSDGDDGLTTDTAVVYSVNPKPFTKAAYMRIYENS